MRITVATRLAVLPICAIILMGLFVPAARAAVTIEIGDYRALAQDFVQHKFGLSHEQALTVMHQYEERAGHRIIDTLELPEGAVLDFVTVDGQAADPACSVTYDGSGVLCSAPSRLFYSRLQEILQNAPPDERRHLLESMRAAAERGWFVQEITPEQRDNLLNNNRAPGEAQMRPQAVRRVRLLVVLNNFPQWDDVSPSRGTYDEGGDREHPLSEAENWHTPGGPLSDSDYLPDGLANPTWSATGIPAVGTNASVSNHPRIEYTVEGRPGTSVDLQERWYTFLFDLNNPLSVANYYFANSHANLSIEGNRSDIVGPLESHHILDRIPYLGGPGYDYAVQPGTPVIRQATGPYYMGIPGLRGLSVDSGNDTIATIGWTSTISISGVEYDTDNDGSGWDARAISATASPPGLRRVVETEAFEDDDGLRARIGGTTLTDRVVLVR